MLDLLLSLISASSGREDSNERLPIRLRYLTKWYAGILDIILTCEENAVERPRNGLRYFNIEGASLLERRFHRGREYR